MADLCRCDDGVSPDCGQGCAEIVECRSVRDVLLEVEVIARDGLDEDPDSRLEAIVRLISERLPNRRERP